MAISETLLPLGQIVATPGALEALARAGQEAKLFLERHASGDWGQVEEHDRAEKDYNAAHGFRILSSYRTAGGASLWIITEADQSSTNRHSAQLIFISVSAAQAVDRTQNRGTQAIIVLSVSLEVYWNQ